MIATPTFTPGLDCPDAFAAHWIEQATLRLRRELCWVWRAPQTSDPLSDALNRSRVFEEKLEFFERDETAAYLTRLLDKPAPSGRAKLDSFDDATNFVIALVLLQTLDAAASDVIAAVEGDARRNYVTLALAQRLWDEPRAIACVDHRILRSDTGKFDWHSPLRISPLIARELTGFENSTPGLKEVRAVRPRQLTADLQLIALGACEAISSPRVIPIQSGNVAQVSDWLATVSAITGRKIFALSSQQDIETAATLCWLRGADLLVSDPSPAIGDIPIYVFAMASESGLAIPPATFDERLSCWQSSLHNPPADLLRECSYRFHFEDNTIREIAAILQRDDQPLTRERLNLACQQRAIADAGTLAERVKPRFPANELILAPHPQQQFEELITAARALPELSWHDAGISALFAGPPGTGKTMAAEVLAERLRVPMYRVDLSQVVNKYIGETEKNLRKLFDAMEQSSSLLFFDEADALFGQRMQVRNAHDRYANLEVSYLLQRMERFRGVAILATNRRKDLDEAFLRRLRFVIEFPLPDAAERKRIWQSGIPEGVDVSDLDFDFLARQFALSGGHIRSIVLYACLQCPRKLSMSTVMRAVDREYEKLDRTLTREQRGRWKQ